MSSHLRITSVYAEAFGGLSKRQLVLPEHPFVVVSGRNEAGKSSMATLIAWLLVGPSGESSFAQRFGALNDKVSGRLHALLGDVPVVANGSFKIIARGAPNENGLTISYADQPRSIAEWRDGDLRGIDASVLQSIYSMSGVDLHRGDLVHQAIARLAVGGMAGAGAAIDVAKQLDERARQLLKASGKNDRSFTKVSNEIRQLTTRLAALGVDVEAYRAMDDERSAIIARLDQIQNERGEIDRAIAAHATAIGVRTERRQLRDLVDELSGLGTVDASWVLLMSRQVQLRGLLSDLERLDGEYTEAMEAFDAARLPLSLDVDEARAVNVTVADIGTIGTALTDVALAREDVAKAAHVVEQWREECRKRAIALHEARVRCPDLDTDALRSIRLDPDIQSQAVAAITRLDTLEQDATGARLAVSVAEQERDSTRAALEQRRQQWRAFRVDVTAEEWLANPGQRSPSPLSSSPSLDPRLAYGAAAVVTVVAVLLLARPIAAAVALLAIVAAFVIGRPARAPVAGSADEPAVRGAAQAVVDEVRRLNDADTKVGLARDHAATADNRASMAASDVARLLGLLGISSSGSAAERDLRARSVVAARQEMASLDEAERRCAEVEGRLGELQHAASMAHETLAHACAGCGVPPRFGAEAAAARIADFHAVTRCRLAVDDIGTRRRQTHDEFMSLVSPVVADVEGWSPADITAQLGAMADLLAARRDLESRIDAAQRAIDGQVGADTMAQSLLDDDLDEGDLQGRHDEFQTRRDHLAQEYESLADEKGQLTERMNAAAKKATLAELQLEIGNLEDERDQVLLDAVRIVLARTVLSDVADEVRRRNQPALITTATAMVQTVVPTWQEIRVDQTSSDALDVAVQRTDGSLVAVSQLSTGAQAVLYLALRLAAADQDALGRRSGLRFPILCDDPLVHLDDERAAQAAGLLGAAADDGHQVILFTCNSRTEEVAAKAGAVVQHFG